MARDCAVEQPECVSQVPDFLFEESEVVIGSGVHNQVFQQCAGNTAWHPEDRVSSSGQRRGGNELPRVSDSGGRPGSSIERHGRGYSTGNERNRGETTVPGFEESSSVACSSAAAASTIWPDAASVTPSSSVNTGSKGSSAKACRKQAESLPGPSCEREHAAQTRTPLGLSSADLNRAPDSRHGGRQVPGVGVSHPEQVPSLGLVGIAFQNSLRNVAGAPGVACIKVIARKP